MKGHDRRGVSDRRDRGQASGNAGELGRVRRMDHRPVGAFTKLHGSPVSEAMRSATAVTPNVSVA